MLPPIPGGAKDCFCGEPPCYVVFGILNDKHVLFCRACGFADEKERFSWATTDAVKEWNTLVLKRKRTQRAVEFDCPCGGVAVYTTSPLGPGGHVECRSCGVEGPQSYNADDAQTAWYAQVSDWIRGNNDAFVTMSLLRPEIEKAAREGLRILDASGNLEKAFSAVRLHLELVVQEVDKWTALEVLVNAAQNRVKAEVRLRAETGWERGGDTQPISFGLYDRYREEQASGSSFAQPQETRSETKIPQPPKVDTDEDKKPPALRVIKRRGKSANNT